MKVLKFLLFALAIFIGSSSAWATETQITIKQSLGTRYNGSGASGTYSWYAKWVSTATPQVTVANKTNTANNIGAYSDQLGLFEGSGKTALTYTLSVAEGYRIKSFTSQVAYKTAECTISCNGTSLTLTGSNQDFNVSDINKQCVDLDITSTTANAGVWMQNWIVTVESVPVYDATLLSADDVLNMSDGDSKLIVLGNPHLKNGYFLGYNGSSTLGGIAFGTTANAYSMTEGLAQANVAANTQGYRMILKKSGSTYTLQSEGPTSYYLGSTPSWVVASFGWTVTGNVTDGSRGDIATGCDNSKLLRFSTSSGANYLNSQGNVSNLRIAGGTGEWSVWSVYELSESQATYYDVTYDFKWNGETVNTQKFSVREGEAYPDPTLPYGLNYTKPTETVTSEQTVTVTLQQSDFTPFVIANNFNDATWYTWKMRNNGKSGGYAKFNGTNFPEEHQDVQPTSVEYLFAPIGNPFAFQFLLPNGQYVNQTAVSNAKATASTTATTFHIVETGNATHTWGTYTFYLDGTTASNGTMNDVNNSIGYWGSTAALSDIGSQITLDQTSRYLYSINFTGDVPADASVAYGDESTVTPSTDIKVINASIDGLTLDAFTIPEVSGFEMTTQIEGRVITVNYTATDPAVVKEEMLAPKLATALALLNANQGYPGQRTADVKSALQTAYDTAKGVYDNGEATISEIETVVTDIQTAIETYTSNTSMITPEEGKVYFLNLRDGSDTASDRTEYYFYDDAVEGNTIKLNATANTNDTEYPDGAAFVVGTPEDGTYALKSALGRYFTLQNATTGTSVAPMSATYNEANAKLTVNKLTSGGNVTKANTEDLTYIKATSGNRVIVYNQSSKSADGANGPFYNGNYTSGIAWVAATGYTAYKVVFYDTEDNELSVGAAAWSGQTVTCGDGAPYFVSKTTISTADITPQAAVGYDEANATVTYDEDTKTFKVTYPLKEYEYTVQVTGLPDNSNGGVTYNSAEVKNGSKLQKSGAYVTSDEVPAISVTNYKANVSVDNDNLNVNVNYILNDAAGLSNTCYYVLQTEGRGHWKYDTENGYIIGTTDAFSSDDDNSKFAWIKSEKGNYYLYNIGQAKFVTGDKTNGGYELTEDPSEPVVINTSNVADYPFYLSVGNWWFNTNGSYKTELNYWNTQDIGNRTQFIYGAEYDLEAVVAKVENYENPPLLTFVISGYNTTVTYDEVEYSNGQTINGTDFDISLLDAPVNRNYLATSAVHGTEIRVTYEQLPFVASDDDETNVYGMETASATDSYRWYKYITDGDDAGKAWRAKRDWMDVTDKTEQWIYKIVNKGSGNHAIQIIPYADTSKCLSYAEKTNGNGIVAQAPETSGWYGDWVIAANGSGIGLKPFGDTENYFLNCFQGSNHKAGFWNSNSDAGSQLTFVPITEAEARFSVTISSATRSTLASEYPLDFTTVYEEDGVTPATDFVAFYCDGLQNDADAIVMTYVTGDEALCHVTKARTGLYVGGTANATYMIKVAVNPTDYAETDADCLRGVYEGETDANSNMKTIYQIEDNEESVSCFNYILQKKANAGVKFYKVRTNSEGGNTVALHRAYLQIPTYVFANGAKEYLDIEGETTGIEFVDQSGRPINVLSNDMYDLNGRRVNEDYKGIVVIGGKKMYNK